MRSALLLFLSAATALASAARLPVAFEPNRGQEPGTAEFIVHTSGAALTLSAGRAEWISRQGRVAVVFESARRGVHGQGEEALPGVVNYLGFGRRTPLTNIPTYARVRYRQLYPGVDVVYYVKEGWLEYDLVLAPGADPRRIRMRVDGAEGLRIDGAGDLVIAAAGNELRQHVPVIYQEADGRRSAVASRYRLHGREVRFAVGSYDRSRPLVIDPALTWATYLLPTVTGATTSLAQPFAMALDSTGNIYVAGTVLVSTGYNAMFVAKLNSTGTTAAYVTLIGGTDGDTFGDALALDATGNIFLAGTTDSVDYYYYEMADTSYLSPYTAPGYTADGIIFKIDNAAQNEYFGHYFGGSYSDYFYGLATDKSGNVYCVGSTNSPDLLVGNTTGTNAAQMTLGGGVDAFVAEFNAVGSLVYSTYLGGSGNDYGYAIAVDSTGNAYVTGSTVSSNFRTAGTPFQAALKGGTDAFVAKIAPGTGTLVYSTYLGGSANDEGNAIAVDSSGAVYITGDTASPDFPLLGAYQSSYGGGANDAFVTKLAGSGSSLIYSSYLGGSGADAGLAIAVDGTGNAYITGSTTSTDYPVTSDAFQSTNQGAAQSASNGMVTAFNPAGSGLLFSSYLGGNGSQSASTGDFGNAIAVNCAAGLVVAGSTSSSNFPATSGSYTATYPGGTTDGFVAQIAAGGGIPAITPGGIVNNANFATGPVAPGSIVSIFGTGMAPSTQVFTGFPLTNSLAATTVSVNGVNAPMFYASSSQINIQLPFEVGAGPAVMTVNNSCGSSGDVNFQVAQAAPYILQTAGGEAIVQNYIASTGQYTLNGPDNPAKAGSIVVVYLYGIGPVSNQPADGAAASSTQLSWATLPYSATIGGWSTGVNFLGLAPTWVGLDQANLVVPGLSTGAYQVIITVNNVASNGPMMYVTQ